MSEKYWSDWIDDIKENTERIEKLEKKNIEFSNYIHEGIGNLVLKNQKELAELKVGSARQTEVLKELSAKDDPYRMCPKCGTCMIVDIATLNKIDWYCPKCAPTIEEWQYTGITLEGKKELIAELIEDFDELIAWTNTFPYSETYIRLKRKREKWEAKLQ